MTDRSHRNSTKTTRHTLKALGSIGIDSLAPVFPRTAAVGIMRLPALGAPREAPLKMTKAAPMAA
jgi:hypothetical protein